MTHEHDKHDHCEHEEVAYCESCDLVYCKAEDCGKEWGDCQQQHVYPWYVSYPDKPTDPTWVTTTTDGTSCFHNS